MNYDLVKKPKIVIMKHKMNIKHTKYNIMLDFDPQTLTEYSLTNVK